MPGPPPKPRAQRRRRNATPGGRILAADDAPARARVPKLPGSKDLLPSTRAWWRTVWASPMAKAWLDADVPALVRLARLQDLVERELHGVATMELGTLREDPSVEGLVRVNLAGPQVSAAIFAEIRQLEDRLGLTPLARRRLSWEIEQAGAAGAGEPSAPTSPAKAQEDRWLRAV